MPVSCLRASLFIHLFIYLCWSLWKCATPFCLCVGRGNVVLCALVLECVCVLSSVDRAFEPVGEIVVRLIISIMGTSCRDRDVEHHSFPPV